MQDKRAMRKRCVPGVELSRASGWVRVVASKDWSRHEVIGELCGEMSHGGEGRESSGRSVLRVSFHAQGNELNFLRHRSQVEAQENVRMAGNCEVVMAVVREIPCLLVVSTEEVREGSELILDNSEYSMESNTYVIGNDKLHVTFSLSDPIHAQTLSDGNVKEGANSRPSWPTDLSYSLEPSLTLGKQDKEDMRSRRLPGVSVVRVEHADHPACGQYMLCAARPWSAGRVLGEYTGKVGRSLHTGDYVACLIGYEGDTAGSLRSLLTHSTMIGIDASTCGNEMRMINDYRYWEHFSKKEEGQLKQHVNRVEDSEALEVEQELLEMMMQAEEKSRASLAMALILELLERATRNAVLGLQAAAKDVWSVVGASSARGNQYYGGGNMAEDVCTWRHDVEGTGIELWKGSFGWFDFMNYDGAPVVLCDTWAVCIERPTQVFPSGGSQYSMLRQAATKKTLENYKIKDFLEEVGAQKSSGGQVQEIPAAEALKGLEEELLCVGQPRSRVISVTVEDANPSDTISIAYLEVARRRCLWRGSSSGSNTRLKQQMYCNVEVPQQDAMTEGARIGPITIYYGGISSNRRSTWRIAVGEKLDDTAEHLSVHSAYIRIIIL
ncbi:hypothetical protein GUITHDRAFT_104172 [Guillardia theta CCMP2712]|uniref:SET domain-containing protein n=1 Tax=Guillardia theta (strain CCMP2712) TaxID=905079 RepID=L1JQ24_GUITC|nr:hypothetical protein GUITHDRAFT_104172 [Guillardia theta CCMP2712]EKX50364.1 hypothetical protein GUITHDRAFT_104172 [Guillardia theta CCMP2712]|eukprot:XP_005837344.1 hypothetical protein GUITHDRAFT_104172 [Guillardia theta CCMP2712]